MNIQFKPTFIGIGAQRSGTTWLHQNLKDHPNILLPTKKEIHFFDKNYELGLEFYLSHFQNIDHKNIIATGEITPNYYHRPYALKRIRDFSPNIKLIYIVRNPIYRAYSQYELFSEAAGDNLSFEDTLSKHHHYIDYSLQGKYLKIVYDIFPKSNVLVLFYDDLVKNPVNFISSIYKFLDVDPSFRSSSLEKRINRAVFPKTQKLLTDLKLSFLIKLAKKSSFSEHIKHLSKPQPHRKISVESYAEFLSIFSSDITLLEELTGRDLNCWRTE